MVWNHGNRRAAAVTIEIHRPELEALILERMKSGAFQNVEDALLQGPEIGAAAREESGRNGSMRAYRRRAGRRHAGPAVPGH
jgi:hypothetical protein